MNLLRSLLLFFFMVIQDYLNVRLKSQTLFSFLLMIKLSARCWASSSQDPNIDRLAEGTRFVIAA